MLETNLYISLNMVDINVLNHFKNGDNKIESKKQKLYIFWQNKMKLKSSMKIYKENTNKNKTKPHAALLKQMK